MPTRIERRAAAREGILAAAHRTVSEAGFAAASVTAVAARAGVASGSIYRHFPSRGELLAEVLRNAAGRELALVAEAAREADAPLEAAVRTWATRAAGAPGLFAALLAEPVDGPLLAARTEARRATCALFCGLLDGDVVRAAALTGALEAALVGPLAAEDAGAATATLVAVARALAA